MSRPKISILGAGPGGLAAALLLSRYDCDVVVHERMDRVGGRTCAIDLGGFRFDMGPTFFLFPQVLREIFDACGACLDERVELLRLDPQYELAFEGGGRLRATPDPERMRAEIAELSPADAAGFEPFLRDNRAKLESFTPAFQNEFSSPFSYLHPSVLKGLLHLRPWNGVDRELMRYFRDPRVRLAFSFQSKYLGMSPFRCPSLFTILSFMEYEHGVFHPRGGCAAVSEAMARLAEERGVEIRLGEAVEEITFSGKRADGVVTPSGHRPCDALVVNGDFARVMERLVPDGLRRRWSDRKLERKKFSCSTFMMYLGIEGEVPDLGHHTIFLAEDYERNIAEIEAREHPPERPSIYVQNACVTDPGLAPEGHSALYVLVPVGHLDPAFDWSAEQDRYRDLVYKRLEELGVSGIRERVKVEKIMTPLHWSQDMEIHKGATFNLAHSLDQMLYFRPHNRFEDLDGVFLVGGGTHPGSGLPVIFESARISSRLLGRDLGLALRRERGGALPSVEAGERVSLARAI